MKKLLIIISLITFPKIYSQVNINGELKEIASKDSSTIPVLFSYPDSIRDAILNVSTYPQGLVKLEEIQKKSSKAFKTVTSKVSKDKQKQLWEITRYPELIPLLIKNNGKNKDELKNLLLAYPDNIKKSAIDISIKNYPILLQIDSVHYEFETNYKNTIKSFPEDVKKSFDILLQKPEVIAYMNNDIKTIIQLGNLYTSNPSYVKHFADSTNIAIVKDNKSEYEDWQNGINNDPEIQKELKNLANRYEKEEENIDDDVYNNKKYDITINITPYPYWVGYPYWYQKPYWYPYPWWYHSGFYWTSDGTIIFGGMPSYYFGWWYFNHPHFHYPKTSDYIHQHYLIHPRSTQGFNRSRRESQPVIKRRR